MKLRRRGPPFVLSAWCDTAGMRGIILALPGMTGHAVLGRRHYY
jgi:hypothetical protein